MMPKRPRLLHVFSTFDHGGAESRTVKLMNHWGSAANHTVITGYPEAMGAKAAIAPHVPIVFPTRGVPHTLGRPGLWRYYRLARWMRDFDLILTYSWGAMDVVMAHRLFHTLLALPRLIHHEDGFNDDDEARGGLRIRQMFRRTALRSSHALVVPSRTLEHIARTAWGVDAPRLVRVANGIKLDAFGPAAMGDPNQRLDRKQGEIIVGTVAGLRLVKNLPRLVRTVAGAGPDFRLVIAGEGPARADIRAEAMRLGFQDRLTLLGFVKDPGSILAQCDIFALSSDSEQCPISLIEAMATGLPVVATDVGDIRSMVAESNRAYVVDKSDEAGFSAVLKELGRNGRLRTALGQDNRLRARTQFQDTEMFAHYAKVYGGALPDECDSLPDGGRVV